jgi:hypothetical protein
MARWLTFRDLKLKKGWPHSRQHTARLAKAGKIPFPKKRPDGGSFNLWEEDEWDAYYATFQSSEPSTKAA